MLFSKTVEILKSIHETTMFESVPEYLQIRIIISFKML